MGHGQRHQILGLKLTQPTTQAIGFSELDDMVGAGVLNRADGNCRWRQSAPLCPTCNRTMQANWCLLGHRPERGQRWRPVLRIGMTADASELRRSRRLVFRFHCRRRPWRDPTAPGAGDIPTRCGCSITF